MVQAPIRDVTLSTWRGNHKDFLEEMFRLREIKSHISEIDDTIKFRLSFLNCFKNAFRVRASATNQLEVGLLLLLFGEWAANTIPETIGHISVFYELVHNRTTTFHVLIVHRAGAVNRHQNARTEFVLLTRNIKSLSAIWSHTGIFSVLIHCVRLESLQDCLRVKFRSIGSKNCLEQTTTNVTPLRSIFCNVVSDFLDFLVYQSIFFPTFRSLFSCVLGAIKILIQSSKYSSNASFVGFPLPPLPCWFPLPWP